MSKPLLLVMLLCSLHSFANREVNEYVRKTNMPTRRYAMMAGVVNDKIYVIGGSNLVVLLDLVEEYDPVSDVWTIKKPMPIAVTEAVCGVVNGKIYIVGGWAGGYSGYTVNTVQEYDPATDTWTIKSSMPTSRAMVTGAVVNNKIYVTSGYPKANKELEVYDPVTDSWTTQMNCPVGFMQDNGGVAIGNDFYAIGGRNYNANNYYDHNLKYNTLNNVWASMAPLPKTLFAGAVVLYNGKIHYFGGGSGSTTPPKWQVGVFLPNYNSVYIYDHIINSWSAGLGMPEKRSGLVAATVKGNVYIIGGMDSVGGLRNEVWEYTELAGPSSLSAVEAEEPNISVYPNPAKEILNVKMSTRGSEGRLTIMDIRGMSIREIKIDAGNFQLDISPLPVGTYMLRYTDSKGQQLLKFTKI